MVSANFPRKGTHVRRKADGMIGEVYASDPSKDVLTVRWRTATGFLTQVCTSEHFARDWEITSMATPEKLDAFSKNLVAMAKALLMVVIGLLGMAFFWPKSCGSESTKQATTEPQKPTEDQLLDSKYLDGKYEYAAESRCGDGVDDYLRSIARYDFAWDKLGFMEPKFSEYHTQILTPGVMVWVSRKAKLQNGFGAYKRIIVTCDYDTQADKVIKYGQN